MFKISTFMEELKKANPEIAENVKPTDDVITKDELEYGLVVIKSVTVIIYANAQSATVR